MSGSPAGIISWPQDTQKERAATIRLDAHEVSMRFAATTA
jgi:hypothetical protein